MSLLKKTIVTWRKQLKVIVRDVLVERGLPLTHTQTVERAGDRSLVSRRGAACVTRSILPLQNHAAFSSRLIDSLIEFSLTLSLSAVVCVRACVCGRFLDAARASSFAAWPHMRNLKKRGRYSLMSFGLGTTCDGR